MRVNAIDALLSTLYIGGKSTNSTSFNSMANTVTQGFATLRSNLEITDLQESTVADRQRSVRKVLETDLNILDSFLTGSYSRSTMIAPLKEADVDIFVVLHSRYYHHYNGQNGGQTGLLDLVKRVLRRTYTRTPDIGRSGQAVTIRFSDFVVDVVPGFRREGGGFLIPNSLRHEWLSTDPKRHVEILSAANKEHNGDLVPLIKMLKGWNKKNGAFFRSFHLEVLVLKALQGVRISDYPSGVRFVLDKMRDLVTHQNPDPAGYGGDVGSYIDTAARIQEARSKCEGAFELALRAEELGRRNDAKAAIEKWQALFKEY